jgi:hypothetical protein
VTAVLPLPAAYHGIHPAPTQAGYERVDWREPLPRATRVRVRQHTCDCRPLAYELCQAGGLSFVRRIYQTDGIVTVESEWLRAALAEQLWSKILLGQAR